MTLMRMYTLPYMPPARSILYILCWSFCRICPDESATRYAGSPWRSLIYIHTCIYVKYLQIHTYIHIRTYIQIHTNKYIYMQIEANTRIYINTNIYMHLGVRRMFAPKRYLSRWISKDIQRYPKISIHS